MQEGQRQSPDYYEMLRNRAYILPQSYLDTLTSIFTLSVIKKDRAQETRSEGAWLRLQYKVGTKLGEKLHAARLRRRVHQR